MASVTPGESPTLDFYYHFDGLGSTLALTNSSGNTTDKYTYDAWGKVTHTVVSGGTTDNPYQYVGQLGYYTHHQEPKLNPDGSPEYVMLQLGVRYYVPDMGRFTQRDRLKSTLCFYEYAAGNPPVYADPRGLSAKSRARDILKRNKKCACLYKVWTWYDAHNFDDGRNNWFPNDKVAHCWFTCKAMKHCGVGLGWTAVMSVGKECYDCVDQHNPGTSGFEDVEWNDLLGDKDGAWVAAQPNSDCLRDCKRIWGSGTRNPPPPPDHPHIPRFPLPPLPGDWDYPDMILF